MRHVETILLAVEPHAPRPDLCARTAALAQALGARVEVAVLRDDDRGELGFLLDMLSGGRGADVAADIDADVAKARDAALKTLADKGVPADAHIVGGRPSAAVLDLAKALKPGLIVKGVNADGADGDDHKLLRGSPTMLWMSRPGSRTGGCVIAALDPDPEDSVRQALAMNVLRSAQTLAQAEKLPLVAAHTWQLFGEQMLRSRRPGGVEDADIDAMRDKARRQARERLDAALSALEAPVDAATPHGVAADALIALATERDADVMVIGTVGRAGMAGMLAGETAEDVLHGAPCDVVAVPPPAG